MRTAAVPTHDLGARMRAQPPRCALTQLNNVCSTRPNVRDAAAMLWPDSTSRTASCLNSSVYRARVAFIIIFPFADSQLRDTFRGGKINRVLHLLLNLQIQRRPEPGMDTDNHFVLF